MSFTTFITYPRPVGEVKFDLKYYTENHMTSVTNTWKPKGLRSMTVTHHSEGPYIVQAILIWDSSHAYESAITSEGGPELFADIPNFTDIEPVVLKGDVKAVWNA
ncbi:hypothetical protein BKA67DRAFT_584772 [Truncatella angustata]|uniref:EthD domain-containing protein n=1 Tax=Truncatella angustata TaxID=152316 RepID=A0A9P8RGD0_9PEZI|nr:uncharacterized protein BKA67DRAFT_584772 [Truncatella angustata]KAH6645314.1 hypothetical protein BKA67DRAFT_584772 [Truncatella angustata]